MEVVSLIQEMLQNVAEYAVSFRVGQSLLRQVDRVLWTVEKCARWAVPPPLDQDEHPQPELIRPLPWVFFLTLLVILRVTRESISLINLVLGKPPLRSADVVMYIQSKRRYLRTLKYQGNRIMRARTTPTQPSQTWFSSVQSLFEFTMCFRRYSPNYGNNNTTQISNNDEVMVVKRNKRGRQEASPVACTSETSMEKLIEKMMVDLQADSDDDSSYTLTNTMSDKSDQYEDHVDTEKGKIIENVIAKQYNESCRSEILKKENNVDKSSQDMSEHVTCLSADINGENNDNVQIVVTTESPKSETNLLLQRERYFTLNNKAHSSSLVNGKGARSGLGKDGGNPLKSSKNTS